MTIIREWAARYGISDDAVQDLEFMLRIGPVSAMSKEYTPPVIEAPASEARQQSLVRLEAARLGVRLFRNNSGAFMSEEGQLVRYGLANESKQLNKVLKSPDLIGWRRRTITAEMVGSVIGQATMREMKAEGWHYTGTDHERAQLAFLELAIADGCDASFATGPGTL